MTWPGFDYHSHICVDSIDNMLAAAEQAGVREYGISEHIFMLDEGHEIFPDYTEEGERFPLDWYVETVRSRAATTPFELRLGLEVDFVPRYEERVGTLLQRAEWDYLIGSIHVVDVYDIFVHDPRDDAHADQLWRDYYSLFIAAAHSGTFDILSHPVRKAISNKFVPEDYDELLYEVALAAAQNDVALELNGNDIESWPQLVERLAIACGRAGCAVSFGSDAHRARSVARGLHLGTEMAVRAGVKSVATFKGRERRLVPLG